MGIRLEVSETSPLPHPLAAHNMHFSEVPAIEAGSRTDHRPISLVVSLYRLGYAILRTVVHRDRRRPASELPTCPSPPSIQDPSPPNDDLLSRRHSDLAQELRSSLSSICNWLEEDDVKMVGGLPISGGGFTDLWRGSLDNRQVAVKSYRLYLYFDPSRVLLVGYPCLTI
jgi:hypothetical protein